MDVCRREAPPLKEIAPAHISACHLNDVRPSAERPKILELS
jgi:hypothetical protein